MHWAFEMKLRPAHWLSGSGAGAGATAVAVGVGAAIAAAGSGGAGVAAGDALRDLAVCAADAVGRERVAVGASATVDAAVDGDEGRTPAAAADVAGAADTAGTAAALFAAAAGTSVARAADDDDAAGDAAAETGPVATAGRIGRSLFSSETHAAPAATISSSNRPVKILTPFARLRRLRALKGAGEELRPKSGAGMEAGRDLKVEDDVAGDAGIDGALAG
jgi:hypothetical protein